MVKKSLLVVSDRPPLNRTINLLSLGFYINALDLQLYKKDTLPLFFFVKYLTFLRL